MNLGKKVVDKSGVIRVISEKCPQNHICPLVKKCPEHAINQEGFKTPTVDHEKCIRCMICVKTCSKNRPVGHAAGLSVFNPFQKKQAGPLVVLFLSLWVNFAHDNCPHKVFEKVKIGDGLAG
jgi:ferredoxin